MKMLSTAIKCYPSAPPATSASALSISICSSCCLQCTVTTATSKRRSRAFRIAAIVNVPSQLKTCIALHQTWSGSWAKVWARMPWAKMATEYIYIYIYIYVYVYIYIYIYVHVWQFLVCFLTWKVILQGRGTQHKYITYSLGDSVRSRMNLHIRRAKIYT